jgi:hypothetical protein
VGVLVKEEVEFLIILVCSDTTGLGWTEIKAGSPPFNLKKPLQKIDSRQVLHGHHQHVGSSMAF